VYGLGPGPLCLSREWVPYLGDQVRVTLLEE
jgi:hypothetical protein